MVSGYLDYAAKAAYAARTMGRFDRAQVHRIIEVLESTSDDKAIEYVEAFILRQVANGLINRAAGRILVEALQKIKKEKKKESKDAAREFLGIFKWLYEACEHSRFPRLPVEKVNFEDFIKFLAGIK